MTDTENKVEEGTLPEGWEEGPLENFCEMYQPKTISKKDLIDDGPYPVYGANGQIGYYSEYNHQYSEVTVTCRGATCGTVNVIPAMSWITGNAMVVRPTGDSMTKSFLAKELESLDFSRIITGTAQPQITRATLSTSQVLVPPLSEQHQIVEILEEQLGRLDAALENVRVVKEKAAQFRRSLLHSAFNGTLTGHTPKEGTLPEGWEIRRLGELADLGPKVPSNLIETNSVLSFVPMKAVSEVSGRVDSSQTITAQEGKRRSLKYFANGDIIFAKITPCMENGKIARATSLINGSAYGSTEFHVFRPTAATDGTFLRLFLVHDDFRYEAERAMTGAVGQRRVPKKYLENFPVATPPLPEQQQIVEILEEQLGRLDAALAVAESVEVRSAELRRSLLHAAFTGRLTEKWREGNRSLISKGTE